MYGEYPTATGRARTLRFSSHRVERLVRLRLQAVSVRQRIDDLQAPIGTDPVVRNLSRLDLFDGVGAPDAEQSF